VLQLVESLLVARECDVTVIAEVAFAPIGAERRLGMAVAALVQLADLAVHLPALERSAQPAAQRVFHDTPLSRLDKRDATRRAASVGQVRVCPAVQRAQALIGGQTGQWHHLGDLVCGKEVALIQHERLFGKEVIRAQLGALERGYAYEADDQCAA